MAIFSCICNKNLYFSKQFLWLSVQTNLCDFRNKERNGWLISPRFGIYLHIQCTEPRVFRVFGASSDKIADVLFSIVEIFFLWNAITHKSISFFVKWHFGELIPGFPSSGLRRHSNTYTFYFPLLILCWISGYHLRNNICFLIFLMCISLLFLKSHRHICETIDACFKSVCDRIIALYCV